MSIKWRQAGDFHPFDWLGQFVSIRMNWRTGFEKRSQFLIGWKRATNCVVAHSSPLRCFKQCCRWIEWEQRVTTPIVLSSKFLYMPWSSDPAEIEKLRLSPPTSRQREQPAIARKTSDKPTYHYQSGSMSDIVISKCLRAHYLYEAFRAGLAVVQHPDVESRFLTRIGPEVV